MVICKIQLDTENLMTREHFSSRFSTASLQDQKIFKMFLHQQHIVEQERRKEDQRMLANQINYLVCTIYSETDILEMCLVCH